ncbi:MAG TPA: Uma2 family endonuclease [Pirellulales bacterium]|jgi:Uma2 family endonuclease|nr:Uma2 family endonuclease [Pirellulales bacterium]
MATVTEIPLPKVELIESDGEPLETLWHFAAISLLMDAIHFHFRPRTNYFVGGNMFFYFSEAQARNRDYRGPDFFFVDQVDGTRLRAYWAVWEEDGRYPDVIIELLSPTTAVVDRTVKKELYERTFRTPEYICYDPATETFEGWRLGRNGCYEPIVADERGWLRCERLGLWLGGWRGWHKGVEGVFPRFYDPQGRMVFTPAEGAAQRAEAQEQRADKAEAQLAHLKAQMAELEKRQQRPRS